MGEQAIPVLLAAAASGDLRSVDDLGEIATASAASALIGLVADESDVAFRAAWWIAALVRHPEVEDGIRFTRPTLPVGVPLFDWVWRPFASNDSALSEPMGRVAWLLAHDVADHSSPSISVIDHRLGIAVMVSGDADGPSAATPAVQQISRRRITKYDEFAEQRSKYDKAREEAAERLQRELKTRVPMYDLAEALAHVERRNPTLAASIIAMLIAASRISDHRQRVFCRMAPGVQYQMIGDNIIVSPWSHRRVTVKQWTEATVPVKAPKLLSGIAWAGFIAAMLAAISVAGYRAFGPLFGAAVGGPGWLDISARIGLVILVSAVTIFLGDVFGIRYMGTAIEIVLDKISIRGRISSLVIIVPTGGSLLACLAIAALTSYDNIGWEATAATFGSVSAVILCLMILIARRNKRIRNPLRHYLTSSPWTSSTK
jgi:hypothetical protein